MNLMQFFVAGYKAGIQQVNDSSAQSIIIRVAEYFGVSVQEILSRRRNRRIANARKVAMYLLWRETDLTIAEIGKMVNRHHSSVIWARNEINHVLKFPESDPWVHRAVLANSKNDR